MHAQIQTLDAVSEQLVWIFYHAFLHCQAQRRNLAEITENDLSVSESGLLSFSITSSAADVI